MLTAAPDHTRDRQGRAYEVRGTRRFRISDTHRGSASLGPCKMCGKHCDTVYLQTEQRYVVPEYDPSLDDLVDADGGFWTLHECKSWFGHEACLLGARLPVTL